MCCSGEAQPSTKLLLRADARVCSAELREHMPVVEYNARVKEWDDCPGDGTRRGDTDDTLVRAAVVVNAKVGLEEAPLLVDRLSECRIVEKSEGRGRAAWVKEEERQHGKRQ